MIGLLRNWRLIAWAGALAGIFASGAWLGREWELGRVALALQAAEAALAEARINANAAEAARLAETADLRAKLDEVTNEILADPAGTAPSLGVLDVGRLNRIR